MYHSHKFNPNDELEADWLIRIFDKMKLTDAQRSQIFENATGREIRDIIIDCMEARSITRQELKFRKE